jgi:hypothetical protein
MRTGLSTPQSEVVSFLVSLFAFLLLHPSLFFQSLSGFLSRWFLGRSVGHRILHSFDVAFGSIGTGSQGVEDRVQRYGRYPDRRISYSIGKYQVAVMNQRAAGVDDIWHITVLLVRTWTK